MRFKMIKKYVIGIGSILVMALILRFIGRDQLRNIPHTDVFTQNKAALSEMTAGTLVEQSFICHMDVLESVSFTLGTYARSNSGILRMKLVDEQDNTVLASGEIDVSQLVDNEIRIWTFSEQVKGKKNRKLGFIAEANSEPGSGVSFYYGDSDKNDMVLVINDTKFQGCLGLTLEGYDVSLFGLYYWQWIISIIILSVVYMLWSDYQSARGKLTTATLMVAIWKKYKFLIFQLVSRDFKTKYKRSVLGYLWSFLNPLLTMMVQYIVFSTLFKTDIKNYPVYLLTGIILFSFFSEAVGQGLAAIVANASLITKVYVPKYIYPITKVMSVSINLFISIIPLMIVVFITGVKFTLAMLLLPFALVCLLLFCEGMVLILCSAMVFFRDTQYLWGIVSMVWMYATPLFYPETIIPSNFRWIQTCNPLYHMIKFARTIIIEGVSPSPSSYFACLFSAVVSCAIGAIIFKRSQNKFVLYI